MANMSGFTSQLGPYAISARYDDEHDAIIVVLNNGTFIGFPVEKLQGLQGADASQLSNVVVEAGAWTSLAGYRCRPLCSCSDGRNFRVQKVDGRAIGGAWREGKIRREGRFVETQWVKGRSPKKNVAV